ncbi:hypothetical protein KSD_61830 [Ktedonobacter sp. SOSP1-85]|uniref:Uncharacterized protein n=1 Tax=Ktedonobacter robiniae TaxID=2778365 RepID=A0ABQ3UV67_9CHLR|nr:MULTISPECIES: hypothetical protein [Ktedonobacter]GHO56721.1 hypothetical protein KSB_51960 [Ktedonobacter robiniae]GHO78412.1 hypothetical protein KSD_61830 [Ktedonobacter sp. SOSP1-85]
MLTETEVKHLEELPEEMIKEIENTATSAEAAVVYGKVGRACSRALAQEAGRNALRTARTSNTTKFQSARQTRLQARKGGNGSAASQPQPQVSPLIYS